MYEILLNLHSWLRWLVLGMAVVVIYNNYNGWKSGLVYSDKDKKLNTYLMLLLHSQLVIGLALYFGVSPMMKDIMANFGGSMKDSAQRFWSVEHMMGMVIGIIVAQIGASKAKKQSTDAQKFKTGFMWFTIAILIIILMIPFGIWNVERPMFRM
ncbi:MAG: cytochrome B [Saprospiraceae bacterium]|nr:cytochrome B [Saprospiraceae bacterium]MCC6842656.1 cytochrome b [Saprospiraceae bacterium]HRG33738.1 cytochrome B [Saprospiraceae bacterium]